MIFWLIMLGGVVRGEGVAVVQGQRSLVHLYLSGDLGNRAGLHDHHLDRLVPKFRTELPTLLCHVLSPPFWTSILWGPLSENFGAPHKLSPAVGSDEEIAISLARSTTGRGSNVVLPTGR